MDFKKRAAELLEQIGSLLSDEKAKRENAMPDGCYFLSANEVVCLPRGNGDARYPYSADGYNLWAYSSGYITVNESTFYVVLPADEGKEPNLCFYAGRPMSGGGFAPVSLLGIANSPMEGETKRYTVYTPQAVYYFTVTPQATYCVRIFVSEDKKIHFSVLAENTDTSELQTYLSAYFNCFLMHAPCETVETKWFKECKKKENGFTFYSVEDISRTEHLDNYGVIVRNLSGKKADAVYETTSHSDYAGGKNRCLNNAASLYTGKFESCKPATKFTETAVAGDIIRFTLKPGEYIRADYCLSAVFDAETARKEEKCVFTAKETDAELKRLIDADVKKYSDVSMLRMYFAEGEKRGLPASVFEKFVGFVMRQVEFAALSKNSGVSLLGVRDVFQQLEAALMWNPAACRQKIVEALGFIGDDGRPPRQYSLPPTPDAIPAMDLRMFIDQGAWIINTVYRYLAYTGDFSILDEECGYYRLNGEVGRSEAHDSVLMHLIRIMRFLLRNIDENTGCLRALYGDWNDALDGMGVCLDGSRQFGSGVSVMATLQLYGNMQEISEILSATGQKDLLPLEEAQKKLRASIEKWAIERKDGERRILHGWGDKRSYLVGSHKDIDGQDRISLTSHAFWVLGGAYEWDKTIGKDIVAAFKKLDSKYGLKTFEPYFALGTPGVGRIINLPKGTAENSATYAHATLFGIWALFDMNECAFAWEQLEKLLPISHDHVSTTQFIMSNSFSYNEEFGMDGESMSDWYTGSANVLIKMLVRSVFGLDARLDGLHVRPCADMPFGKAQIRLKVRDAVITLDYAKEGRGKREISSSVKDSVQGEGKDLFIPAESLKGNITVTVRD